MTDTTEPELIILDDYEGEFRLLCEVKAEEFRVLGYGQVRWQEVWACARYRLKKPVPLHQAVADVLSLQVGQFMNFMTVNAYQGKFVDETFDAGNRS